MGAGPAPEAVEPGGPDLGDPGGIGGHAAELVERDGQGGGGVLPLAEVQVEPAEAGRPEAELDRVVRVPGTGLDERLERPDAGPLGPDRLLGAAEAGERPRDVAEQAEPKGEVVLVAGLDAEQGLQGAIGPLVGLQGLGDRAPCG